MMRSPGRVIVSRLSRRVLGPACTVAFLLLALAAAPPARAQVQVASKAASPDSVAAGGLIDTRVVSDDGRFVVFASPGAAVAPGQVDTNNARDAFLRDRTLGTVALVSHVPGAPTTAANGATGYASISGDGRFVLFLSLATDLVGGTDSNADYDVFLYEVATGTVSLVSHRAGSPVDAANGRSDGAVIDEAGRFVAFTSAASAADLVAGASDPFGGSRDLYLYERASGQIVLISHRYDSATTAVGQDSSNPHISADGSFVAFQSPSANLISGSASANYNVFLYRTDTRALSLVSHASSSNTTASNLASTLGTPSVDPILQRISGDGAYVVFVSTSTDLVSGGTDLNGLEDVFLYDTTTQLVSFVSHELGLPLEAGDNGSKDPAISADGNWIAFRSKASNLVAGNDTVGPDSDIFLFDRASGTSALVSHAAGAPTTGAGGESYWPSVSADGGYVAFDSTAPDLVTGQVDPNPLDADAFVFRRSDGEVRLVSHAAGLPATAANGSSIVPVIGASADAVVYLSDATDLSATGDGNSLSEVVAYDRATGANTVLSASDVGLPSVTAAGPSGSPRTSRDGRYVVFVSKAPNLVPGQVDTHGFDDVFLYDRVADAVALVSHVPGSGVTTGNNFSEKPAISADGNWVAFLSAASDLVPGSDTNSMHDLFLFERATGVVTLVTHAAGAPTTAGNGSAYILESDLRISNDGAWIAYESSAANLVAGVTDTNLKYDVFLYERATNSSRVVSHKEGDSTRTANNDSRQPALAGNGAWVAFRSSASDLLTLTGSSMTQVYLYSQAADTNVLASHAAGLPLQRGNALATDPSISDDASRVAFVSGATDLVAPHAGSFQDVFLYRSGFPDVFLVSHKPGGTVAGNDAATGPRVSADGAWVAFLSASSDLVTGQTDSNGWDDVFLYSVAADTVTLLSGIGGGTTTGNSGCSGIAISADGSRVTFQSSASSLVSSQTGTVPSIFLYDRTASPGSQLKVAVHTYGTPYNTGNGGAAGGTVSGDGSQVAVASDASNFVTGDLNGTRDVFVTPSVCVAGYPANPTATANGNNRIDIAWTSPSDTFEILRSRVSGGPYQVIGTATGTGYADTSVDGGLVYYYRVRNQCGTSNQASASALGACSLPPLFGGATSAWQIAGATCSVKVTWGAATAPCGGALSYAVHRGTDPAFVPTASNRVASGLSGASYVDTAALTATQTYYYVVRALAIASGEEDGNLTRQSVAPLGCAGGAPEPVIQLAVTTRDLLSTVEWVNPGTGYVSTRLVLRNDRLPTGPADGTTLDYAGTPGAPDQHDLAHATNGTYYWGAFVDSGGETWSSGRTTRGRTDPTASSFKWAYTTGAAALSVVGVLPNGAYFVPSNDRVLHALTPGPSGGRWPEGPPAWKPYALSAPSQSRPIVVRMPVTRVAGADTIVLLGSQDGRVHALDGETGQLLWASPVLGAAVQASPSLVLPDFGGSASLVLVGSREPTGRSKFYGLDVQTGAIAWTFDNGGGPAMGIINAEGQVSYPDRVYFTSRRHSSGSPDTVWCLDFSSGSPLKAWSRDVGDVDGAAVLQSGVLYVGNNAGQVYALDPDDGTPLWTGPYSTGSDGPVKGYVWRDLGSNRLYFSTSTRVHAVVDRGPGTTPAAFWPTPVATIPSPSPPLVWEGRVYVGGGNSRLYSIDAAAASPPAPTSVVLGDPVAKIIGSPTLDTAHGLIVVGSEAGIIYAVATPF
jgi:Tol biopolymer transport system component/outer membrane protein assembly factor BamB